jgi:2-hydroxy-6-oxonona-2,4-dienedioate hydrolase/2-hydroxy-6-oxo-6-(2'-carboxyphenyl)-hexa-2,4-dienoate hydrolase
VELLDSQIRMVRGRRYTTRVIEAGGGEPLILIHGVGSHAEVFARNIRRLAEQFHVYAIDALYHGYSSTEPYDAEHRVFRQAEAVIDFMDAAGIEWAHVEGESMGAGIAFDMGLHWPERCGRLVFNSGSFFVRFQRSFEVPAGEKGGSRVLETVCRESVVNLSRETVRARMEFLVATPERVTDELVEGQYRLYSDPAVRASMLRVYGVTAPRSLGNYPEEVAATLKPPVLVMWTGRNRSAGPEVGEYLASVLPGARYYLVADAAHWPQWEQPEEHDRVVLDFLRGRVS